MSSRSYTLNKSKLFLCTDIRVCMQSCFCCVPLFVTLWTVTYQAPLSMGFSRQEYWSGYALFHRIFLTQGLSLHLLHLLHWQMGSLVTTWEAIEGYTFLIMPSPYILYSLQH